MDLEDSPSIVTVQYPVTASHDMGCGCEYALPFSCPVVVVSKLATQIHSAGRTSEGDFNGELEGGRCQGGQDLNTIGMAPKYLGELLDWRLRSRSILDACLALISGSSTCSTNLGIEFPITYELDFRIAFPFLVRCLELLCRSGRGRSLPLGWRRGF